MADIAWKTGVPRTILLATDLGARCDRALERALVLARQWQARLVVLTVVEPPAAPPPGRAVPPPVQASEAAVRAAARLRRDVGPVADVPCELLVREGQPGECIQAVADETGCSLVITGVADDALFGRHLLGSTVGWLARQGRQPLLVVHDRARAPYARVVVATDFSPSSARALSVARALFPEADTSLFNAFEVPYLGLRDGDRDDAVQLAREAALEDARAFLAREGQQGLPVAVARGDAAARLAEHALAAGTELVVLATHGRSALFHLVIGSVAREILDASPCDTLLVPEPKARGAA